MNTVLRASRLCSGLAAALSLAVTISAAPAFDNSGNATVNGPYFVRQVLLTVNSQSAVSHAQSLVGIMTFNGAGSYSFTGQLMDSSTSSAQSYTSAGGYAVSAAGLIMLQNPLDSTNACISNGTGCERGGVGAAGPNAIVASATEGAANDMFVAIPVGSTVSNASLNGTYRAGFIDFYSANSSQVRGGFFTLTSGGGGTLGNISVVGSIANQNDSEKNQTFNAVTYSLTSTTGGTLTFPTAATPLTTLLSGVKAFMVSSDGNLILGGGQNGFDIIVGTKATSGQASNSNFTGTYYTAALENNRTQSNGLSNNIDSYYGSLNASGAPLATQHSRVLYFNSTPYDLTIDLALNFGANGTFSDDFGYQLLLGQNGQALVTVGSGTQYTLAVGLQAKPVTTGNAVFIDPFQVFNAASNAPITNSVAPGEYVSIQGKNLSAAVAQPSAVPFGTTLGGTSVTVNGIPAALSYVSPTQVNLQVPYEVTDPYATFQVTNNGAQSNTVTLYTSTSAPGVFTVDLLDGVYGVGNAAVQHSDYSLVTQSNPAVPGENLIVYLTGLGKTSPLVADGAGAPSSPFAVDPDAQLAVFFDNLDDGTYQQASIAFQGLTPGAVGLYQVNLKVPTGVTSGQVYLDVQTSAAYTTMAKIWLK